MGTEIFRETGGDGVGRATPSPGRRNDLQTRRAVEGPVKTAPRHYTETFGKEKNALTSALGWFSVGLGAAELLAPAAVARVIGIDPDENRGLLRVFGLRELIAGVGILTRPRPTYWMWNRVLGDSMDLAALGRAMRSPQNDRARLGLATAAVLGVTALDIATSLAYTRGEPPAGGRAGHDDESYRVPEMVDGTQQLGAVITINKPIEEVYAFWKDPQNFPLFIENLESVKITGKTQSHWKVKAPVGLSVEWDAEITDDVPNERISWQSVGTGDVQNSGAVRFRRATGNRTEVELETQLKPKGGVVGARLSKLFAAIPKTQIMNDLRRFKQLIEVGEIIKSDATAVPGMHPARPPRYSEMEAER
jgi:uncharacterized membrane protein